jgi:8-oxo-dGTP diphosphatase
MGVPVKSPRLKLFKPRITDEYFERAAWICVRDSKRGVKEVLFVRSLTGDRLIIPGGRTQQDEDYNVLDRDQKDERDKLALIKKIKLDLTVDLVPETVRLFTSFGAPAYGKDEGVVVGNKYYFADHVGTIQKTPEVPFIEWLPIDTEEELTAADIAVMRQLYKEGIIN